MGLDGRQRGRGRWRGNGKTWSIAGPDKGGYGGAGRRDEPRMLGSWGGSVAGVQAWQLASGRSNEALCAHNRSNIYILFPRAAALLPASLPLIFACLSRRVPPLVPPRLLSLSLSVAITAAVVCVPFFTSAHAPGPRGEDLSEATVAGKTARSATHPPRFARAGV